MNLYNIKKSLFRQNETFQHIFDEFRNNLEPKQMGNLLIQLDSVILKLLDFYLVIFNRKIS